jgi:hypothetical protein
MPAGEPLAGLTLAMHEASVNQQPTRTARQVGHLQLATRLDRGPRDAKCGWRGYGTHARAYTHTLFKTRCVATRRVSLATFEAGHRHGMAVAQYIPVTSLHSPHG